MPWFATHAHRPAALLISIAAVAGILSEVPVNDAVRLMLTPLAVETARGLKRNLVPYLLELAMASATGSTATITGNPQNMMIASFSRIANGDFAGTLVPFAAAAVVVVVVVVALAWRPEFLSPVQFQASAPPVAMNRAVLAKSLIVTAGRHHHRLFPRRPAGTAAMPGGSLLFVTRRIEPHASIATSTGRCCSCSSACSWWVATMQKAF